MTGTAEYPPFALVIGADAPNAPAHLLELTDEGFDPAVEVFEAAGWTGNGHEWEGVARFLLAEHAPALAEAIEFDSEAGCFTALSTDPAALTRLAALMHGVFHDHDRLAEVIRDAGDDLD